MPATECGKNEKKIIIQYIVFTIKAEFETIEIEM